MSNRELENAGGIGLAFGLILTIAVGLAAGCHMHHRGAMREMEVQEYATLSSDQTSLEIYVRGEGVFDNDYQDYTSHLSVAVRYNPDIDSCGFSERDVAAWFAEDSMHLASCNYLSSRVQDDLIEYVYTYTFTGTLEPYRLPTDVNGHPLPVPLKLYFGEAVTCDVGAVALDTATILEQGAYDYRRGVF